MKDKLNIAVLFGGQSPEHEVSRKSAAFIADTLSKSEAYNLFLVGINKQGEWKYFPGETRMMRDGSWEIEPGLERAFLTADTTDNLLYFPESSREAVHIDCVFPVLHGSNGEDGRIQGMLEMSGIPFVGCGMLSSALAMDKSFANKIMDISGIPHTPWCSVDMSPYRQDTKKELDKICSKLEFPIFVKPANAGSSIGISRAENRQDLDEAINLALNYDRCVVLEQAVKGRELEISALGTVANLTLSVVGEVIPDRQFYDYSAKYEEDSASQLIVPAKLSESELTEIKRYAAKTFEALNCYGMARIDFFLSDTGEVLVNEVNTIPGFVDISMYPRLLAASGISAEELLDRLIELAFERYLHGK
ncbi:MAG: D-alanine--D-alanine ligase [Eubacteriales bacterium]|nr:D-alanine--D-alanine ligase [Eubacteriales bacterium]MDD4541984.1 D-alanine--D-alanine ligase [Eubacteriales bacterium]